MTIFPNFLSKRVQSGFLVNASFSSFWIRIYNFCFETETIISRAFDARLGTFGTFFMFVKKKRFYQKAVGFNVLFIFQTLQKLVISKEYSVLLWLHLAIVFWKEVFGLMPNKILWIYLWKIPLKELFVVCRPANCDFIRKELLQRWFWETLMKYPVIFLHLCYKEHAVVCIGVL